MGAQSCNRGEFDQAEFVGQMCVDVIEHPSHLPGRKPASVRDRRTLRRAVRAQQMNSQHGGKPLHIKASAGTAFIQLAPSDGCSGFQGRYDIMKDFAGRIAVVTGGGSGMGRELVRQLVAEGCNVAMCDVFAAPMAETERLCEADRLPQGLRITTHIADVSDEAQVQRFRDEVAAQQETDKIHLLFNNAGIGGGGSLIASSREEWEKTFNVCWGGVYHST